MTDISFPNIDLQQGEPSRADARRWLMLLVVLLATFMGSLDTFIVNVAAPSLETTLHASFADIQLVLAGYTLAFAVVLVTGGRLGDLYGRKQIFLLGVAGFTLFSALCGWAPGTIWLIVFRICQGSMAALMLPQVVALLTTTFFSEERGRALSYYIATMGLAAILGQVLGGLLLAANILGVGWRNIFLVNIPIGLVTIVAAWFLVPETRRSSPHQLDLRGVILLSVTLFLLIYPLVGGSSQGWSFWSMLSLVIALLLLGIFVSYEWRLTQHGGTPIVPLSLFQMRSFVAGICSVFLVDMLFGAILLTLPFYLQEGLRYLPWQSGCVVMIMGIAYMLASSVSAQVVRRLKAKTLHLGAALVTLGYLLTLLSVLLLVSQYGIVPLLVGLFVTSAGNGTLAAPVMNNALQEIKGAMVGAASGVYAIIEQIASVIGVALIGTLFATLLAHHKSYIDAFSISLMVIVLVSLLLSFTVFLFPRMRS